MLVQQDNKSSDKSYGNSSKGLTRKSDTSDTGAFEEYASQLKIKPYPEPKGPLASEVVLGGSLPDTKPAIQKKAEEEEEPLQGKGEIQLSEEKKVTQEKSSFTNTTGIPHAVKGKMEGAFNTDFSNVRIHNNSDRSKQLGALAFTQGSDIHFTSGQYNPETKGGQELLGHELTHVVQQRQGKVQPTKQGKGFSVNDSPALENEADVLGKKAADFSENKEDFTSGKTGSFIQNKSDTIQKAPAPAVTVKKPAEIIQEGYGDFKANKITTPQLAVILLPYCTNNAKDILEVFDKLDYSTKDNLAYALAAKSNDTALAAFDKALLQRMSAELGGWFNTTSWGDNRKQQERINKILSPGVKAQTSTAATDLEFMRKLFNNNITGAVGVGKANAPVDVQLIARGLQAKSYAVPAVALTNGTCNQEFIDAIKKFQKEVVGAANPDGIIDVNGLTIKKLFDKSNNSYSSGMNNLYGTSVSSLGNSIGNTTLKEWKRTDTFNAATNQYDYSINNTNFIDRATYNDDIKKIAKEKGVVDGSDQQKALGMAAKAATDNVYFGELTKNIGFALALSDETAGSHQVNSVLKNRLMRFHKFMSAIGMFRGNMTGSACRTPVVAHRIAIPHVVKGNVRPEASKQSIRNNLISVFNNNTVAGGSKATNGNIQDSDGNVWAQSTHFEKNAAGAATAMKDTDWFSHLETFQPGRNWNTYTAEGYKIGDSKRFPLGLNAIPDRSNHITGDAIDINQAGFTNMNEAMIDLIALNFGLNRPVPGEQWHFECTNVVLSAGEQKLVDDNPRESTVS
jgi:hypothetical protein